jgi:hypothetical protein
MTANALTPKIAVYTIALNEAQFAERWAACAADADYRVVADTGSTDETVERLKAQGVSVYSVSVKPWRFDRARDASLALVPGDADICICLDMDEVLPKGWREHLLRVWTPGNNRLKYTHIWSWHEGKPAFSLIQDRVHGRHSHRWMYPAHECAAVVEGVKEVAVYDETFTIEHHPDPNKSRGAYLNLLRIGAKEYPVEGRMAHYYGRELMFQGQHQAAIDELKRHLAMPYAWVVERAQSMLYVARCCLALGRHAEAEGWFIAAARESAGWRDPWVELAQMNHDRKDWLGGWWAAERALAIVQHTSGVGKVAKNWGALPWDLASVCAWWAGAKDRARECVYKAAELDPTSARIKGNVELMTKRPATHAKTGPEGKAGERAEASATA